MKFWEKVKSFFYRSSVMVTAQFSKNKSSFNSMNEMVNPSFPFEAIPQIKELALTTPDLTQTVKRMIALGNTGIKWDVTGVSEKQYETILREIDAFLDSQNGIVNRLMRQIIITGAMSAEVIHSDDMGSVETVKLLSVEKIRFKKEEEKYTPYYIKDGFEVSLNPETYTYEPIETDEDCPYGIPLFLGALTSLLTSLTITDNAKKLIEKWGLMGFITFTKKKPNPKFGQDWESYNKELTKHLYEIKNAFEANKNTGFIATYDDTKIEHHSIATSDSSNGYEKIYRSMEEQVSSGLDIDPALLGRTYSTTETYAGMVYNAFLSKMGNIRYPVKRFLKKCVTMHLLAKGYKFESIQAEWGEPYSMEKQKDAEVKKIQEEAYQVKVDTLIKLYNQGILDNQAIANELGYEKPYSKTPIQTTGLAEKKP